MRSEERRSKSLRYVQVKKRNKLVKKIMIPGILFQNFKCSMVDCCLSLTSNVLIVCLSLCSPQQPVIIITQTAENMGVSFIVYRG